MPTSTVNGRNTRLKIQLTHRVIERSFIENGLEPVVAFKALRQQPYGFTGVSREQRKFVKLIAQRRVKGFRMANEQFVAKVVSQMKTGLKPEFDLIGDKFRKNEIAVGAVQTDVRSIRNDIKAIKDHLGIK